MEKPEIEARVRTVFQNLFDVDPASVTTDSSADNVPGWDSMQHLNLITSLEQEFGVSLSDNEVVEMLSFGLIVEILAQKPEAR